MENFSFVPSKKIRSLNKSMTNGASYQTTTLKYYLVTKKKEKKNVCKKNEI